MIKSSNIKELLFIFTIQMVNQPNSPQSDRRMNDSIFTNYSSKKRENLLVEKLFLGNTFKTMLAERQHIS